jgi:hypothetical protein
MSWSSIACDTDYAGRTKVGNSGKVLNDRDQIVIIFLFLNNLRAQPAFSCNLNNYCTNFITMKTHEEHFAKSCELRNNHWKSIGEVDPYVMAHIINPAFMGGPAWPAMRQAFMTIHAPERTILASDGLSDPYGDMETNTANAPYNGFGLEVYVATEKLTVPVDTTWQFQLLYQAALLMADQGNMISVINDLTYMTTEFYEVDVPDAFKNAEGRVGAFIGLPDTIIPGEVQLSLEPVKMVNIKLLTIPELEYVINNGEEGRAKLAELLIAQGNPTWSTLERASVV